MDFVDNVINTSTGTIRGRAVFANPNDMFTPGMFARLRVPASPPYEALLVPDAAIGTEQVRKFVLMVDADNMVVPKYVTLGQTTPDGMRVIKTGITADDRVDRQWVDARAAGSEGHAAGRRQGRTARARHRSAEAGEIRLAETDAYFAFFHRPADLRLRGLDRFRDPRRRRLFPSADRAISGDRAADHHRDRPVSRRQRRRGGRDGGGADRAADQRRREHDLS